MICYRCNADIDDNSTYCPECGYAIVRSNNYCTNPKCEAYVKKISLPPGEHYCKYCGSSTTDYKIINDMI